MSDQFINEHRDNVARGLRNMGDTPDLFIYFGDCEDWFDGDSILGIPVYNSNTCMAHSVSGDEECPLMPVWKGEVTDSIQSKVRVFQLSFANTGDFPA
tara:strand:+ start:431 stop:724 length:294 start_codon:yes stop_codon:yes gene_type:complete